MLILKLKCPKHPRYNPPLHLEDGIRGGCQRCMELLELYLHSLKLRHDQDDT